MTHTDPQTSNPSFHFDERGTGWITLDDPDRPVNVLTEAVMRGLGDAFDDARAAAREGKIDALVIRSGKPDSFVTGADIDAIAELEDPGEAEAKIRLGQAIFNDLESLPVTTVAAVHGACVGGGVELALACDYRVLSDGAKTTLQFPEVMLGLLPAWGGTTRLPRLVGLQASLDMLLTGRKTRARKAKKIGLATELLPAELFGSKVETFVRDLVARQPEQAGRLKHIARAAERSWPARRAILTIARKKVLETTGGHYPAPLRILQILEDHLAGPPDESLAAEARAAAELIVSPVCKNLLHVYHLREAARKGTGTMDPAARPGEVRELGVLGAGVMGGGIAQLAAQNDVRVYMKDIRHEAVTSGLQHARSLFDRAAGRGRMTRREAAQHMELIAGGLDYHGLRPADLVVEAVVERMAVKQQVLRETEQHVAATCVLATNTSSLSVDGMAEALERPERFCGMHFFNPVDRMPLVEVVRGAATTDQAVATVYAFALALGKVPVVVRDGPGFLVNRILGPYLNEAGFLLGDGAAVEQIDRVAKAFGMPMGPLRLIDEIGIDVSGHAGAALHEALGDRMSPSPALKALGNTDRLGRKGGAGFYRYEKGREKGVDESIYELLGSVVPPLRELDETEIRTRLLFPMVNEAARLLDEGIVATAADVDLAMIMGTGFPPFRGGLLRFADTLHPRSLLEGTRELHDKLGDRFEPAPLVASLANDDRTFYEAFPWR
ncbi:MAG: 3-hydroxyacyl-CoA dehydrogenase NAD-binding domain-containing protein [Gemmatimonadota bacterium]|nr:3-hydroxyacyl-CoA dehydrogenase NAD-binding domain-containing protein [Gemmatimonadota bacterium]